MRIVSPAANGQFPRRIHDLRDHGEASVETIADVVGGTLSNVAITTEPDEYDEVDILARGWYDEADRDQTSPEQFAETLINEAIA